MHVGRNSLTHHFTDCAVHAGFPRHWDNYLCSLFHNHLKAEALAPTSEKGV